MPQRESIRTRYAPPNSHAAMHPAQLSSEALLSQCEMRLLRRGGPGGQHRNKVETAVILTHTPSRIAAEASERRSQADNRRNALFRLRLALATHFRQPSADLTTPNELPAQAEPSRLWQERASGTLFQCSAKHDDYPALLAELLDVLASTDFDLPATAQFFGSSSSQLVRLLRQHQPALQLLNNIREKKGLHKLT